MDFKQEIVKARNLMRQIAICLDQAVFAGRLPAPATDGPILEALVDDLRIMFSDRFTAKMGDANYRIKRVRFSKPLWTRASADERWQTIVHEFCHIAVGRLYEGKRRVKSHGSEWQDVMIVAGAPPQVCHRVSNDGLVKRYVAHCECRRHEISGIRRGQIRRGGRITCTRCMTRVVLGPEPQSWDCEMHGGKCRIRAAGQLQAAACAAKAKGKKTEAKPELTPVQQVERVRVLASELDAIAASKRSDKDLHKIMAELVKLGIELPSVKGIRGGANRAERLQRTVNAWLLDVAANRVPAVPPQPEPQPEAQPQPLPPPPPPEGQKGTRPAVGHFLLFIGGNYYTADSFTSEAAQMGISRRMPNHRLPSDLVCGQSRVYVAEGGSRKGEPSRIFGYFVPQRVEFIAGEDGKTKYAEVIAALQLRPDSKVIGSVKSEPARGCGTRKEGGTYIVVDKADSPLIPIVPPVLFHGNHFRGLMRLTEEQVSHGIEMRAGISVLVDEECMGCGAKMQCSPDGHLRADRERRRIDKGEAPKWRLLCPPCLKRSVGEKRAANRKPAEEAPPAPPATEPEPPPEHNGQQQTKPAVDLVGKDGNAFMILGICKRASKKAGWTPEQWDAFHTEATKGDYDHLLATVQAHFEVS